MVPHAFRHLPALFLALSLILPSAGTLDAKPHKHGHHQRSRVPWAGEETAYVRDHTIGDRWHASIKRMTDEVNTMTQHMPDAPTFVYLDDANWTCDDMITHFTSGINICVTKPGEAFFDDNFAPPGCPVCASARFPVRTRGDTEDGWRSWIYLEDTDASDLIPGSRCGREGYAKSCSAAWTPGGQGFNLVSHEFGHAVFGILDHTPGSTVVGIHPWGPTDFARAEAWFGASTVPFCDLYPHGMGC